MKPTVKKILLMLSLLMLITWPSPLTASADELIRAKVVATSLNVRSEPGAASAVVGSLSYGTIVSISKESYGWAKISSNQTTGWVAGYYLQKTGTATVPSPKPAVSTGSTHGTVLADALRVRKGPGLEQGIVHVLSQGTTLEIITKKNDWLQIRTSDGKTGWVSSAYVGGAQKSVVSTVNKSPGLKGKVIVIDPGHGGSDVGAIGTKTSIEEKTLNRSTALQLATKLRQRGAKVIMTRTGDNEKPSLADRAAISKANAADAFISIHYNSSIKPTSGTLTFFYSETRDYPLARSIEARLQKNQGLPSNGVSFGNYHVLRENTRPSVLVELGFLSNPKDEAIIRTANYQEKAAQAIADGLADYFGK